MASDIRAGESLQEYIARKSLPALADGAATETTLLNLVSTLSNITVTGPLTNTQLRASAVPISVASVPSHAVTNAGTFAVQVSSAPTTAVTIATAPVLVAGAAIIGKVGIDQTTPGTTNLVQLTGYDSTNALLPTAQKKVAASTYSPSTFKNLGANATLNVKASTGNVYSVSCYNANAAARYIQLHNTATTPSAADPPMLAFTIPATSQIVIGTDFFTNEGINFSTGIAFAFSTTIATYTAATAAEQMTFIQYK